MEGDPELAPVISGTVGRGAPPLSPNSTAVRRTKERKTDLSRAPEWIADMFRAQDRTLLPDGGIRRAKEKSAPVSNSPKESLSSLVTALNRRQLCSTGTHTESPSGATPRRPLSSARTTRKPHPPPLAKSADEALGSRTERPYPGTTEGAAPQPAEPTDMRRSGSPPTGLTGFGLMDHTIGSVVERIGEISPESSLKERFESLAGYIDSYFAVDDLFTFLSHCFAPVGASPATALRSGTDTASREAKQTRSRMGEMLKKPSIQPPPGSPRGKDVGTIFEEKMPIDNAAIILTKMLSLLSHHGRTEGERRRAEEVQDVLIDHLFVLPPPPSEAATKEEKDKFLRQKQEFWKATDYRSDYFRLTKEVDRLQTLLDETQERLDSHITAYDQIVQFWQRYTMSRLFKAWRVMVATEREERKNEEARALREKNAAQLQQLVMEKNVRIEALESKVGSLMFLSQQERSDHNILLESEREVSRKAKKDLRSMQEEFAKVSQTNLELQAKNVFLQSELQRFDSSRRQAAGDTPLDDLQSAMAGASLSTVTRRKNTPSEVSNGSTSDEERDLEFESLIELVEDFCDSIAPVTPTKCVPSQHAATAWIRVYDGLMEEYKKEAEARSKKEPDEHSDESDDEEGGGAKPSKVDSIELCHQEKLSTFSYDVQAAVKQAQTVLEDGLSREIPFPISTAKGARKLPDVLQLYLATSVCFSAIPPEPTVCIKRRESPKVMEVRARIIDAWNRARQIDSLRTKVGYDLLVWAFNAAKRYREVELMARRRSSVTFGGSSGGGEDDAGGSSSLLAVESFVLSQPHRPTTIINLNTVGPQ